MEKFNNLIVLDNKSINQGALMSHKIETGYEVQILRL